MVHFPRNQAKDINTVCTCVLHAGSIQVTPDCFTHKQHTASQAKLMSKYLFCGRTCISQVFDKSVSHYSLVLKTSRRCMYLSVYLSSEVGFLEPTNLQHIFDGIWKIVYKKTNLKKVHRLITAAYMHLLRSGVKLQYSSFFQNREPLFLLAYSLHFVGIRSLEKLYRIILEMLGNSKSRFKEVSEISW